MIRKIQEDTNPYLWHEIDDSAYTNGGNVSEQVLYLSNGLHHNNDDTVELSFSSSDELETLINDANMLGDRLESEGWTAEEISKAVASYLLEESPGLAVDRGEGPYDVSIRVGSGWGVVAFFDSESRRCYLSHSDKYDQESWGSDESLDEEDSLF